MPFTTSRSSRACWPPSFIRKLSCYCGGSRVNIKRTGAKNRRYTDVHWQSVPTWARFLCFWGRYPRSANSRKFTREGAAVSSCGGKRIRPPPPFRMVKLESRPSRWDFSTAKRESRPAHWDFSTAKRESRPAHWDFSTAKRESTERLFRRGARVGAGRREKASSYARKAGLPVLRVSQTTQKLRRLLSCFLARKE